MFMFSPCQLPWAACFPAPSGRPWEMAHVTIHISQPVGSWLPLGGITSDSWEGCCQSEPPLLCGVLLVCCWPVAWQAWTFPAGPTRGSFPMVGWISEQTLPPWGHCPLWHLGEGTSHSEPRWRIPFKCPQLFSAFKLPPNAKVFGALAGYSFSTWEPGLDSSAFQKKCNSGWLPESNYRADLGL